MGGEGATSRPAVSPATAAPRRSLPSVQNAGPLLEGWCHLWGAAGLAPEISLEISTRMTRSLGRCYPDRQLIRIADFVLEESEELFREVLCHEAAHLAAYQLHGKSIRPHGREWKALMVEAGYEPAVKFKGVGVRPAPEAVKPRQGLSALFLDLLGVLPLARARSIAFKRRGQKRSPDSRIE